MGSMLSMRMGLMLTAAAAFRPPVLTPSAFSPLKTKLATGQNATLLVIGDSTDYSDYGCVPLYAKGMALINDCKVNYHLWAEWNVSAATGPLQYNDPVVLRAGAGPTLDVYNAAIPGQVAAAMFDDRRKVNGLDAIPRPDVVILDHGHNMQNFNIPYAGEYSGGRGMFFAAIAAISEQWPGVPIVLCTQNPWRDSDAMAQVYTCQLAVVALMPTITLVDSYADIVALDKAPNLYRSDASGNVHLSDTVDNNAGQQVKAGAYMKVFDATQTGVDWSTEDWTQALGTQLITNGDLLNWTAAVPAGWQDVNNATIVKDTVNVEGGKAWAASVSPNIPTGNQSSSLRRGFSTQERALIAGKTISIAMRIKAKSTQRRPYIVAVVNQPSGGAITVVLDDYITSGSQGTFEGYYWAVAAGLPCDPATANNANAGINAYPAFGVSAPSSNDPLVVDRLMVVQGTKPVGRIA